MERTIENSYEYRLVNLNPSPSWAVAAVVIKISFAFVFFMPFSYHVISAVMVQTICPLSHIEPDIVNLTIRKFSFLLNWMFAMATGRFYLIGITYSAALYQNTFIN